MSDEEGYKKLIVSKIERDDVIDSDEFFHDINQHEGAVHSKEAMDRMEAVVLNTVPLYFDNGVDERVLIGTATVEPDGEITMQIDRNDFVDGEEISKAVGDSEHWGMSTGQAFSFAKKRFGQEVLEALDVDTVKKFVDYRRPEILVEPNNEEIWVKRRTY